MAKAAPIKHSSWVVATTGAGKQRKYLLGKRAKGANNSGQWGFFGGTNDAGETPQQAGHREFHEESGLAIHASHSLGTHKTKIKHNHFFLAKFDSEVSPSKLDLKETAKHAWKTQKQIKRMKLHSSAHLYFNVIRPKRVAARLAASRVNKGKITAKAVPVNDPEGHYELHGIKYDQAHGLGNVPFNQEVNYRGFSVHMRPSQFAKLAAKRDFAESSIKHITMAIKNGKPIGSPHLYVDFDAKHKKPAVITSHEGHTRMEAIKAVHGDVPVLVHIFPNGKRSKDISAAHIQAFQQAAVPENQKKALIGPHFGEQIYHNGHWQDIKDMAHKTTASDDLAEMQHIELKANHSHIGGRIKSYDVHLKSGRKLGVIFNDDPIDQPQTAWRAMHKSKFTEHPSKEHAAVHVFKKAKPAKWEIKADTRQLEVEAGLFGDAKAVYHGIRANLHRNAGQKHLNDYNKYIALSKSEPDNEEHKINADASHTAYQAHKSLNRIHAKKYDQAKNWRDNSGRIEPGFKPATMPAKPVAAPVAVKPATPVTPATPIAKPVNAAPPPVKDNDTPTPKAKTKPYKPPAEPDTSKLKGNKKQQALVEHHLAAGQATKSKFGKLYHQQKADEHQANIKQKAKPLDHDQKMHEIELKRHQSLVKKHTKVVEGLKTALADPKTSADIKKKQRTALTEHNGHLKNALHNVKQHTKALDAFKKLDEPNTKPAAKPIAKPKTAAVNIQQPKKTKLKKLPQAVATKRRERAA